MRPSPSGTSISAKDRTLLLCFIAGAAVIVFFVGVRMVQGPSVPPDEVSPRGSVFARTRDVAGH